jgi:SAM-dependent methyltransferase
MSDSALVSFLQVVYHKLPKPPSTNYMFKTLARTPYEFLGPSATIFDIGSKNERGTYAFGAPPPFARVVCVDVEAGPGVDLVADAHDLNMVADGSVDCVVTVSTLEHVRHPHKVLAEIHRILRPGGILYVSVPFVFPFHSDPYDFYRFSSDGVRILCQEFECIESGFNRGPASCMAHLLVHFLALLFSFNRSRVYGINVDLFTWLLFWIKYLDAFLGSQKMSKVIHSGAFFLGRKAVASRVVTDNEAAG